ncbi:MAG: hypothetical protein CMG25_04630 [Candidatus Marinimicrobia bacterium]|nr:hypothetical protein [Candidatus Neomarinimicrobiota bacterium]|tara:strand:+ start:10529 stop:11083 length:555 start_codon:yes stop_codon:yes gene_type:complete
MKNGLFIFYLLLMSCSNEIKAEAIKENPIEKNDKAFIAPEFSLNSYNDDLYALSDFRGKVVLLNFWATWCGPCIMEIPEFNELYDKYHKSGFEILGISLSDTKRQLIDFAKTYGVKYPLLYGSSEKINKIASDYGGVSAVPWSFLIDTNGEIITIYPGAILKQYDPKMYQDLVNNIEKYLGINK